MSQSPELPRKSPPEKKPSFSAAPALLLVAALLVLGVGLFFLRDSDSDRVLNDKRLEQLRADAAKRDAAGAGKGAAAGDASAGKTGASVKKKNASISGGSGTAGGAGGDVVKPRLSGIPGTGPRLTLSASNVTRSNVDATAEPWKMREDRMELREPLLAIGNGIRAGGAPPAEIVFPLFDGENITLTNIRFKPQRDDVAGVFIGQVADASGSATPYSHALLSYYNGALVGDIHTADGRVFAIRNVNSEREAVPAGVNAIYLAQNDPAKMPVCGTCKEAREKAQAAAKTASASATGAAAGALAPGTGGATASTP